MSNVFKNTMNNFLTSSLFLEASKDMPIQNRSGEPIFSLHEDVPGLINARKTFLALEDPTGYLWAMKYLNGSYDHWQRLMESPWFKKAYSLWMEELKARFQQQALDAIRKIADQKLSAPPATVLAAARYLAEAGWEKKSTSRGRPSGAELKGELRIQAQQARDACEDMERVGLSLVKG